MSYRVRVNLKNYKGARKPFRLGTAQYIPREGQSWEVLWDGVKGTVSYHASFIEVVGGGDSNLFIEGGWRTPDEFARDVVEAVTVNCNDKDTRGKTIALLMEKLTAANGKAL